MTLGENKYVNEAAIIFDGMAVLQNMKKTSSMTKIFHLKLDFLKDKNIDERLHTRPGYI